MPPLPLAGNEQNRKAGALPRLRLRNFYVEPDPSNAVDGLARLQRPGLEPWVTVGLGPINGVFQQDGTLGGDTFAVSGGQLYQINSAGAATLVGTVADQRAQFAASAEKIIVCNGGFARCWDGSTFRAIVMPDGQRVSSVAFLSGFFLFAIEGTDRVYYMEPGETDPDALSFFEGERFPDGIVTLAVNGDELWLIGSESEEVWIGTGGLDAPFEPAGGRVYENGALNRDTLVQIDNALFYVARDGDVMIAQGVPQPISKPDVAESIRLADNASLRAWAFRLDGHLFLVLTHNLETWVYDVASRGWFRWASWQSDAWRAHLGTGLVAGDSQSGALWRLVPGRSNDAGEPMERRIAAGVEVVGAPVRCDSVSVRASVGNTTSLTQAPRLELRWSDDEGNLWTDWRAAEIGRQGQYRRDAVYRRLGLIRRPGRIFEFRATDDAEFRISHAQMNEAVN